MIRASSFNRALRLTSAAIALGFAALAVPTPSFAQATTETARKSFNVPADNAETALKRFSEQSGQEVLFPTDVVRGVRTNAVRGQLSPREALEQMVADTGLTVVQDSRTGAFTVRRASNAAPAAANATPRNDGTLELETFEVSSSRIGGPVNQTIFDTTENGAYNYDVISRVDIERMGVNSFEELLRFVPQTSDYGSTALQGAVGFPQLAGGMTYQNSEVKLRGFSSLQTSILINGRRLQRGNLTAGPDLNRIPISAIERIEILPSSASAVYGGGAIGGVINVILRKDYAGRDLTVYAGTATEGGATEYRFSYFEGRSFNEGRTRLTYTLSYQTRDETRLDDRDFLDRALDRYGPESSLLFSGRPVFEQFIIPAFAAAPGTIVINSPTGSLGIPGDPTARYAAIPAGLTAAQAAALTPEDFNATANEANLSSRYGRSIIYRPEDRYSLNAQVEHDIFGERLQFYGEFGLSYFRSQYSFPQGTTTVNLSATDSLNPFRTNAATGFTGRPVTIYVDASDLPPSELFQERQGARTVLGVKGKIGERWDWSLDGTGEYGRSHSDGINPTQNLLNFINSTSTFNLTQAQRRAIYNPLADHSQFPATSAMEDFWYYNRQFSYYNYLAQANFRVVGDVFDLPAGPLRISPGAEYIWFQARTGQVVHTAPGYLAAVGGSQGVASITRGSRRTESVFVEAAVPVISEQWRPIPLESVDLNFAARWEGTDDSTDKTSPTAGIRVGITPDVAVRVNYSEGFFPPDQSHYEGSTVTENQTTPADDPFRGGERVPARTQISGGNPNLKPETSEAWNFGVILTPRFVPGLTLSVDYWKIEKENAIVPINGPFMVVENPTAYPADRIQRAPASAEDIAKGWLGPVTVIDWRPINVGFTATDGADIRARYEFNAGAAGRFTLMTTATWTNSFRDQILVTSPIVERVGSSSNPLKWRGNASLFWERDAWTAGLTARYIDDYVADSTTRSPAFPTATGFDGDQIGSATTFDVQLSYRIPASTGVDRGLRNFLNGTKWTIGAHNVLNKEPEFRTDRFGFYSRYEDPRMRYVYLEVKKSL